MRGRSVGLTMRDEIAEQVRLHRLDRCTATIGLMAVNLLVFAWQSMLDTGAFEGVVTDGGLRPAALFGLPYLEAGMLPVPATLITYQFLHGNLLHLVTNMAALALFGSRVERAIGPVALVGLYVVCGIAAAMTHALVDPASALPLIGASGAISGLVGAFMIMGLPGLAPVEREDGPAGSPAWEIGARTLIAAWVAWQVVLIALGTDGSVAWWSHLGGFAAGAVLSAVIHWAVRPRPVRVVP